MLASVALPVVPLGPVQDEFKPNYLFFELTLQMAPKSEQLLLAEGAARAIAQIRAQRNLLGM
ncbi:MAG: hypothetical protein ACFB0C_12665 [Leptolyngbyaceae cyanobacterium]